jgi:hypothetical protein
MKTKARLLWALVLLLTICLFGVWQCDWRLVKAGTGTQVWATVMAPEWVIRDTSKVVSGNPESWHVVNFADYEEGKKTVVVIRDGDGHSVVYLAGYLKWMRLNSPSGIPFINSILSSVWRPRNLSKAEEAMSYASDIAYLYEGPYPAEERDILTGSTFTSSLKLNDLEVWLSGNEKNPDAFKEICVDPKFSSRGSDSLLEFNAITNRGAVEKWTVVMQGGESLIVSSIEVKQIRPPGTFSYGLVD